MLSDIAHSHQFGFVSDFELRISGFRLRRAAFFAVDPKCRFRVDGGGVAPGAPLEGVSAPGEEGDAPV